MGGSLFHLRVDSMRRASNGFTLLELLITIAVIGLLIGLLSIVIGRARESARNTQCLNNLRQLALGVRLYTDRHQGRFPDGEDEPWFMQIAPILQEEPTVFRCPSDPQGSEQSYSYRDDSVCLPEASLAGKKIDHVAKSELVMIFDAAPDWHVPDHIQVTKVSSSAEMLEVKAFEDNLLLGAESGSFLNLNLPPGVIPDEEEP